MNCDKLSFNRRSAGPRLKLTKWALRSIPKIH